MSAATASQRRAVASAAARHDVDQALFAAIVTVESAWHEHAVRYEPRFRYLVDVPGYALRWGVTRETETALQRCGFGLSQIMGGTARWLGFEGELPALFDVETNLEWGARRLRGICDDYPELTDRISAYNRGSVRRDAAGRYVNQAYVERVLAALAAGN